MQSDIDVRTLTYTTHFLKNFSHMYRLWEPDDEMIQLYSGKFEGVHLSHLVNAFTQAYEQFKDAKRFPSPAEILTLAADEKRAIGSQESGPLRVFEGNQKMLEIFLKAFRESGKRGKDLEDHLNAVVEEHYPKLCRSVPPQCNVCQDRGWYRTWFLYYVHQHRQVAQPDADGKLRTYFELNRVPNGPVWMQDREPEIEVPQGQGLADGIVKCECEAGKEFSFPKIEEIPE